MKSLLVLLPFLMATLFCGCATSKPNPKYNVFPNSLEPALRTCATSGVRLRMAEDLRAYSAPLVFHVDNTVTVSRDLMYYAPLEVALARALEDITLFTAPKAEKLKVEVRDYCLIEHDPATLKTPEGGEFSPLEVRVALKITVPGKPSFYRESSTFLPADADVKTLHEAFAKALLSSYPQEF